MNTADLFYKSFCILKIKVALISCRWSKVPSKAGENNRLIRPLLSVSPAWTIERLPPLAHHMGWGRTSNYSDFPVWERVGWGNLADAVFWLWYFIAALATRLFGRFAANCVQMCPQRHRWRGTTDRQSPLLTTINSSGAESANRGKLSNNIND